MNRIIWIVVVSAFAALFLPVVAPSTLAAPNIGFRPPCDSRTDRMYSMHQVSANGRRIVFYYRLDDIVYTVHAVPSHCAVNPLLPTHSFILLRRFTNADVDSAYVMYNPAGLPTSKKQK